MTRSTSQTRSDCDRHGSVGTVVAGVVAEGQMVRLAVEAREAEDSEVVEADSVEGHRHGPFPFLDSRPLGRHQAGSCRMNPAATEVSQEYRQEDGRVWARFLPVGWHN